MTNTKVFFRPRTETIAEVCFFFSGGGQSLDVAPICPAKEQGPNPLALVARDFEARLCSCLRIVQRNQGIQQQPLVNGYLGNCMRIVGTISVYFVEEPARSSRSLICMYCTQVVSVP